MLLDASPLTSALSVQTSPLAVFLQTTPGQWFRWISAPHITIALPKLLQFTLLGVWGDSSSSSHTCVVGPLVSSPEGQSYLNSDNLISKFIGIVGCHV